MFSAKSRWSQLLRNMAGTNYSSLRSLSSSSPLLDAFLQRAQQAERRRQLPRAFNNYLYVLKQNTESPNETAQAGCERILNNTAVCQDWAKEQKAVLEELLSPEQDVSSMPTPRNS